MVLNGGPRRRAGPREGDEGLFRRSFSGGLVLLNAMVHLEPGSRGLEGAVGAERADGHRLVALRHDTADHGTADVAQTAGHEDPQDRQGIRIRSPERTRAYRISSSRSS